MTESYKVQGSSMVTYTGKYFDPLNPRVEDICIEDIAHALSNLCRFNGHTTSFYSVAQHSVMVSMNAPRKLWMAALLHDAAEAYIGDMVKPLKQTLPVFREIEDRIMDAVATRFKVKRADFDHPDIKLLDVRALRREQIDLTSRPEDDWSGLKAFEPLPEIPTSVYLPPTAAKKQFLDAFELYTVAGPGVA